MLTQQDMLDCLKLVHCHPGSQLQDIRRVKDAINELAHVYAELKLLGAGLEYIDVGGGLGVDYDGSGTNYASSMNYTLNEYANDVVYRVASVCNARGIPHPLIVSESGRAIAAHHSVLIFNTLGTSALDKFRVTGREDEEFRARGMDKLPQPVLDLLGAYRDVSERRLVECWHDALTAREQCLQMFNLGPDVAGVPRPRRAALLGHLRQDPRTTAASSTRCPRSSRASSRSSPTSTSATCRCSSRCRTAGRSTSCSRSCRSTGSPSARRGARCSPTSPATPTARSTTS